MYSKIFSSFYSEEKTLSVQNGNKKSNALIGGGEKFYGRELRDFDDKEIESLLSNLTTEELEDLNNDFDPDVSIKLVVNKI